MKRRIVITGMGVVSPCGNTVSELWNNLIAGKSGIGSVDKFDTTDSVCKIGGEVKNFDLTTYGINRKEANRMDDTVIYALAAANMAIQDAKLQLSEYNPMIGVILGTGMGGFASFEKAQITMAKSGARTISPYTIPTIMPNAMAAEISIKYKLHGPTFTINAACASSLYSIASSIQMLQDGIADIIVTGGSEAVITPLSYAAFTNMQALCKTSNDFPEKASRPFDKQRSGFIMSEGSAILVIETLESALKRGAHIYAEIAGYGMSSDAYHITQPGGGAAQAMINALDHACIAPQRVDYINAHGTSTFFNDKLETEAIKNVLGKHAYQVLVSSTKSMTGHLLGAAAAIETIACVQAIITGVVPPTINYEHPDPECDLNYVPNTAVSANIQVAMNNSLGFGGHNGCLIVKTYDE